jgi:hypothetical protein
MILSAVLVTYTCVVSRPEVSDDPSAKRRRCKALEDAAAAIHVRPTVLDWSIWEHEQGQGENKFHRGSRMTGSA